MTIYIEVDLTADLSTTLQVKCINTFPSKLRHGDINGCLCAACEYISTQ